MTSLIVKRESKSAKRNIRFRVNLCNTCNAFQKRNKQQKVLVVDAFRLNGLFILYLILHNYFFYLPVELLIRYMKTIWHILSSEQMFLTISQMVFLFYQRLSDGAKDCAYFIQNVDIYMQKIMLLSCKQPPLPTSKTSFPVVDEDLVYYVITLL